MKDLKIEVPNGYEIDKENSTFDCIKFKEKVEECKLPTTWEELKIVEGYHINSVSDIRGNNAYTTNSYNNNIYPSKKLAEAGLALIQLLQLRDRYNEGWAANWDSLDSIKYFIYTHNNRIDIGWTYGAVNKILAFKTELLRDKFLENFRDLIETAKPLL